jgi:hypothetical protein
MSGLAISWLKKLKRCNFWKTACRLSILLFVDSTTNYIKFSRRICPNRCVKNRQKRREMSWIIAKESIFEVALYLVRILNIFGLHIYQNRKLLNIFNLNISRNQEREPVPAFKDVQFWFDAQSWHSLTQRINSCAKKIEI